VKVEEEWEDENEELLEATQDTKFALSLRVTNDKSGSRPITYNPVHFKGCRFQVSTPCSFSAGLARLS
jgi:hypothetical protein